MQVILMQDVQHLGSLGDQVQVKDGFARNFLLPRGMAIMATSKRSGQIEHHRKRLEQLRQQAIEKAQSESDKVAALVLRVQAKAGRSGKLFGSVTNRDVQAALAEQGYELDRRSIQLHTLIKSVGNFTATVRLHTDVKVDVGIRVEAVIDPDAEVPAEVEAVAGEAAAVNATGDYVDSAASDAAEAADSASEDAAPPADADDAAPAADSGATAASAEAGEAQDAAPETAAADGAAEDSPAG